MEIREFFQERGFEKERKMKPWRGMEVYGGEAEVPICIGQPVFVFIENGIAREASVDEAHEYIREMYPNE